MHSTHSHQKTRNPRIRIETEEEYEHVIEQLDSLWDAVSGTPEAQARDIFVRLVEEYETRNEEVDSSCCNVASHKKDDIRLQSAIVTRLS
jgi:hypothetical protein